SRPLNRVEPGRRSSSVSVDLPVLRHGDGGRGRRGDGGNGRRGEGGTRLGDGLPLAPSPTLRFVSPAARVDRNDDGLRAKCASAFGDERLILYCRGVDRDFVGARRQQSAHIFDRPDAASNRKWNEDRISYSSH